MPMSISMDILWLRVLYLNMAVVIFLNCYFNQFTAGLIELIQWEMKLGPGTNCIIAL